MHTLMIILSQDTRTSYPLNTPCHIHPPSQWVIPAQEGTLFFRVINSFNTLSIHPPFHLLLLDFDYPFPLDTLDPEAAITPTLPLLSIHLYLSTLSIHPLPSIYPITISIHPLPYLFRFRLPFPAGHSGS